jgi:pyrroline-5-carboxylate reductase
MFRFINSSIPRRISFMPATERILQIHNMVSTQKKSHSTVAFIGGGNMAEAIIGGMVSSGHPSACITFSDLAEQRREYMKSKYPDIQSSADNLAVIANADVVILAVKPQVLHTVVTGIADTLQVNKPLVVSIVAGIAAADIDRWIGGSQSAIVRCMPNTPALVGEGAAGLYATETVTAQQKNMAEKIVDAIAKESTWVENETLIDAVTAISGSGPAYFFLIMEAMGESHLKLLRINARAMLDRVPGDIYNFSLFFRNVGINLVYIFFWSF